jgi:uncharacterized protein YjbI with pentapeptide repeats
MKQKKSILAVIFSLIFSIFFLSGQLFAAKDADVKKLWGEGPYSCPNCDLSKLDWKGKDLSESDLSGANLSGAFLIYINLSKANLKNANLTRANLEKANLTGANLKNADLSESDLIAANLSDADLSGANLKKARMFNAKLNGANLSGADLSKANLSGADLSGADLTGANLIGMTIDEKAISTNKFFIENKEKEERKTKAKQEKIKKEERLALQKEKEKEKADRPKNDLSLFYQSYAGLKKCYEARKGYGLVHVNSVEMKNIKSKAKSIESGIFKKYPEVKPMKDEIWNKSTRTVSTNEIFQATLQGKNLWGVPEITSKLSDWQEICNDYKRIYNMAIKMYGGGGTTEKDF